MHNYVLAIVDDTRGAEKHNPIDQYIYQFYENVAFLRFRINVPSFLILQLANVEQFVASLSRVGGSSVRNSISVYKA